MSMGNYCLEGPGSLSFTQLSTTVIQLGFKRDVLHGSP